MPTPKYKTNVRRTYQSIDDKIKQKELNQDLSQVFYAVEDFFTFNKSIDDKIKDINIIKNIISKTPTNNYFEIYFDMNEVRSKFDGMMNSNRYTSDLNDTLSQIFDEKNLVMKTTAYTISGLSQTMKTKEFNVLNQNWATPSQLTYDSITVNFYDPIIQYFENPSDSIPINFNLNQFFKIWMDNMYIMDSNGKVLKTRMRYMEDFIIPRLYIIQYFPVIGAVNKNDSGDLNQTYNGYDLTYKDSILTNNRRHVKDTINKFYNQFSTTIQDVFDEHENAFATNSALTNLIPIIKGANATIIKLASIGKLGFEIAEYVGNIASESKIGGDVNTDIFNDFIKEYIQTYQKFFNESDLYHRFSDNIKDRYQSERQFYEDIQKMTYEQFINFILSNESIQKAIDDLLKSPEIGSIIGDIHSNMGIKYGILENTNFSKYSGEELEKLLNLISNSSIISSSGETKEKSVDAIKVKILLENLKNRLKKKYPDTDNSLHAGDKTEYMNDNIVKTSYDLITGQKLEDFKKIINSIYYRQENAKSFWGFNFGPSKGLGKDPTEEAYDKFLNNTVTDINIQNAQNIYLKYYNSFVNDFVTPILGLVTAYYSILDLGKTITLPYVYLDNIINSPDKNGVDWYKEILTETLFQNANIIASGESIKSTAYAKIFMKYVIVNYVSEKIGEVGEVPTYLNIINKTETNNNISSSSFSGVMKGEEISSSGLEVGSTTMTNSSNNIKNIGVKIFTLYNVWPENITWDSLSFDDSSKLSSFSVKFRCTHIDEDSAFSNKNYFGGTK